MISSAVAVASLVSNGTRLPVILFPLAYAVYPFWIFAAYAVASDVSILLFGIVSNSTMLSNTPANNLLLPVTIFPKLRMNS